MKKKAYANQYKTAKFKEIKGKTLVQVTGVNQTECLELSFELKCAKSGSTSRKMPTAGRKDVLVNDVCKGRNE